jgi:hypothetical protein
MTSDLDDAPVRLSAECVGRARDFIRRVTAEEAQFLRQYIALLRPAKERHARYPGRKIRPEMLAELGRRWRYQLPAKFRISFLAHTTNAKGSIIERRLGIGHMERVDDPDWTGHEDGVWIIEARFIAGNDGARSHHVLLANFSLHAIARWYQRSGRAGDAELMDAMSVVANLDLAKLEGGGGMKITTDTDGGGWRGQPAMVEDGEMKHQVVTVRTWLAN